MYLYLKEIISKLGNDELVFFQTAYYWRFQKHHGCIEDVTEFRTHATIPRYVEEYVHHLQRSKK